MKPTTKPQTRDLQVPLQRTSAVWLDEPGYGGTAEALAAFDAAVTAQLETLAERHPAPRQVPSERPR